MFSRIYRTLWVFIGILLIVGAISQSRPADAHEKEWPGQKLKTFFPEAKKFVQRSVVLTPTKITAIEKELGSKLRKEDHKPVFYIPLNAKNKPIGLVLFADTQGPRGVIDGAVGLNMKGKIVKVAVYEHKESDAIAAEKFLKQFIGMDIDSPFKVGKDVKAVKGQEAASKAVALLPKKTLVMSYALFLKRKPKPKPEKQPQTDSQTEEMPEVKDLKELMMLMVDAYLNIVDYFETGKDKAKAVAAAKQLVTYAKGIAAFEPPKNAEQVKEYAALHEKFGKTLTEFAERLEQDGISDETRKQWKTIVALVKQAHRQFSEKEVDLEAY